MPSKTRHGSNGVSIKKHGKFTGLVVPESALRKEPLGKPSGDLELRMLGLDESVKVNIYNQDGSYNVESLRSLDHVLRCRRTDDEKPIEPRLFTILSHVYDHFGGKPIDVVSGYRNQRKKTSNHYKGTATDIRIEGVTPKKIRVVRRVARHRRPGHRPLPARPVRAHRRAPAAELPLDRHVVAESRTPPRSARRATGSARSCRARQLASRRAPRGFLQTKAGSFSLRGSMAEKQLDLLAAGAKASAGDVPAKGGKRGGGKGGSGGGGSGEGGGADGPTPPADASLADEAQRRYLNYAVSVITSRALPDVRDGLKPVQRRILYAMYANLHLYPDAKFRKCATIVGEVLGKYHPHGDASSYEAMVRMAQWFSLRYPLVEGHGNFGSLDGDSPAAYRYTEARLAPLADGAASRRSSRGRSTSAPTTTAPPRSRSCCRPRCRSCWSTACTGIAVGMATNIPPHNLEEVCQAAMYGGRNHGHRRFPAYLFYALLGWHSGSLGGHKEHALVTRMASRPVRSQPIVVGRPSFCPLRRLVSRH